jgi:hypothetical protein
MEELLIALERQRLDADRGYNDALTAFDRAIVAAGEQRAIGRAPDQEDVAGLEIAVDDARAVDGPERAREARGDRQALPMPTSRHGR